MKTTVGILGIVLILFLQDANALLLDLSDLGQLRKVLVVYRHGDRAPENPNTFPTDPNRNFVWTDGYGNLTSIGKNQAFDLGRYLAQRYQNFLTLATNEVFARSSSVLRCIYTTACILTGIYRPNIPQDCFNSTNFTPSPVYTVIPAPSDHMLYYLPYCPKYTALLYQYFTSSTFARSMADAQVLLPQLRQLTGNPNLSATDIATMFDTFEVQSAHGLTLPDWAIPLLPQLRAIATTYYSGFSGTMQLASLQTGFLLNDILMRMVEQDKPNTKLYLFGTHDLMVMGIMKLLRIYNGLRPPYAAAIMIEVYKDWLPLRNCDYIQIFYRNSSVVAPYKMQVQGCSNPDKCPVSEFIRLTQPSAINDPQAACEIKL